MPNNLNANNIHTIHDIDAPVAPIPVAQLFVFPSFVGGHAKEVRQLVTKPIQQYTARRWVVSNFGILSIFTCIKQKKNFRKKKIKKKVIVAFSLHNLFKMKTQ